MKEPVTFFRFEHLVLATKIPSVAVPLSLSHSPVITYTLSPLQDGFIPCEMGREQVKLKTGNATASKPALPSEGRRGNVTTKVMATAQPKRAKCSNEEPRTRNDRQFLEQVEDNVRASNVNLHGQPNRVAKQGNKRHRKGIYRGLVGKGRELISHLWGAAPRSARR